VLWTGLLWRRIDNRGGLFRALQWTYRVL
jgi:hypothetical protein